MIVWISTSVISGSAASLAAVECLVPALAVFGAFRVAFREERRTP